MKNWVYIFFILIVNFSFGQVYYVATSGDDNNDGLTEATAWKTIQKGIDSAMPGDVVWVKGGNYGDVNLVSVRSGTSTMPILIKGYLMNIGDVDITSGEGYVNYDDYTLYGYKWPDTGLPLLETNRGNDNNPTSNDIGFEITHDYIVIENFWLQFQYYGFNISGNNVKIKNCAIQELGNWDRNQSSGWGKEFSSGNLTGIGVRVTGDYFTMESTFIANCGHENFITINNINTVTKNNIAVTNRHGNTSDYGFVWYNSDYAYSENDRAYRYPSVDTGSYLSGLPDAKGRYPGDPNFDTALTTGDDVPHHYRSHAIKKGSDNGVWKNPYNYNSRFWVYLDSNNNEVTGLKSIGTGESFTGTVMVADNSIGNRFYDTYIEKGAIEFGDTTGEGDNYDGCGNTNWYNTTINTVPSNITSQAFFVMLNHQWNSPNSTQLSRGIHNFYGGNFSGANYWVRWDAPFESINLYDVTIEAPLVEEEFRYNNLYSENQGVVNLLSTSLLKLSSEKKKSSVIPLMF